MIKTGSQLKSVMRERDIPPEKIAYDLQVTATTVARWLRLKELKRTTALALSGLDYLTPMPENGPKRRVD